MNNEYFKQSYGKKVKIECLDSKHTWSHLVNKIGDCEIAPSCDKGDLENMESYKLKNSIKELMSALAKRKSNLRESSTRLETYKELVISLQKEEEWFYCRKKEDNIINEDIERRITKLNQFPKYRDFCFREPVGVFTPRSGTKLSFRS